MRASTSWQMCLRNLVKQQQEILVLNFGVGYESLAQQTKIRYTIRDIPL